MNENVEPNAFDYVPLDQLKGQAFVVPEEAEPAEVSDDLPLPLSARLIAAKPPSPGGQRCKYELTGPAHPTAQS